MIINHVKQTDIDDWLVLAGEVEPLFGPMVGNEGFQQAIKEVIEKKEAFGIRDEAGKVCGVIVISSESNGIEWFAVAEKCRNRGYGRLLLDYVMSKLDTMKQITVQTFAHTVPEGLGARSLYLRMGFQEVEEAGLNPAGIPTVILRKERTVP